MGKTTPSHNRPGSRQWNQSEPNLHKPPTRRKKPETIAERVRELMSDTLLVDVDEQHDGLSIRDVAPEADSLDLVELMTAAEEEFAIEIDEDIDYVDDLPTVGEWIALVEKLTAAQKEKRTA